MTEAKDHEADWLKIRNEYAQMQNPPGYILFRIKRIDALLASIPK